MRGRRIELPCYDIVVWLEPAWRPTGDSIDGYIASSLYHIINMDYAEIIDGIEALILCHAKAGVDITSPAYIAGIESAVEGFKSCT